MGSLFKQNEIIIMELYIAGMNVPETFKFLIPYALGNHGDTE